MYEQTYSFWFSILVSSRVPWPPYLGTFGLGWPPLKNEKNCYLWYWTKNSNMDHISKVTIILISDFFNLRPILQMTISMWWVTDKWFLDFLESLQVPLVTKCQNLKYFISLHKQQFKNVSKQQESPQRCDKRKWKYLFCVTGIMLIQYFSPLAIL